MKIELTQQEVAFLLQILDQVTVRGVEAKAAVLQVMIKLGKSEDRDEEMEELNDQRD